MINGKPNSTEYQDVISASGVFGHFLLNPTNAQNEFIYCFNPRTKKYLALNATIKEVGSGYWSGLEQVRSLNSILELPRQFQLTMSPR